MEVASPNSFHMLHVFSTVPLVIFTPMSQRVKALSFLRHIYLRGGGRSF